MKSIVANQDHEVNFFCGGSRNWSTFIHLFDGVFVLEVDVATLNRRLDGRPQDEFGGKKKDRELVLRLHQTKEDIPKEGIIIDAAAPIEQVVDEIVQQCK
ncbi:hypothetical protein [Bacillus sp. Marseille-Q1617]|uniref:hypothetical protein n=1 Tax=Bacillus sp. Marseille-Q1617 TaxID=2736887 RepID=UPI001C37CFDC|nr:hypothetical protein [Bacillus sp. Marseille-Q1617]